LTDQFEPDARASDAPAKRELFNEANELLAEKSVFMLAVRALRIRWYGELMDAVDRDKKNDLLSKLKVLDSVPLEIKRFISDYQMTLAQQAKHARR
jgi:hypothetical protein